MKEININCEFLVLKMNGENSVPKNEVITCEGVKKGHFKFKVKKGLGESFKAKILLPNSNKSIDVFFEGYSIRGENTFRLELLNPTEEVKEILYWWAK